MTLFPTGSVQDLILRGFDREAISARTGVDPGYHNSKFKTELKEYDRTEYKAEFVRQTVSRRGLLDILERYAAGTAGSTEVQMELGLGLGQVMRLKDLFGLLGLGGEFGDADRRHRNHVMRAGFEARYGTDNPFKMDSFQEKAARTREDRYGARYTLADGSSLAPAVRAKSDAKARTRATKEKRRQTMLERHGVEHAMQSAAVQRKAKATMHERHDMKSTRVPETSMVLARIGPDGLFPEDSAQDLMLRGFGAVHIKAATGVSYRMNKDRYSVSIAGIDRAAYCGKHVRRSYAADKVEAILGEYAKGDWKRADLLGALGLFPRLPDRELDLGTMFAAAGYGDLFMAVEARRKESIQAKIDRTNLERYGTVHVFQSEAVKAKSRATTLARYGVENVSQSDAVKKKKKATCREHYGVDYAMQSEDVREGRKARMMELHGVENPSQLESVKAKKREAALAKYGVESVLSASEVREKQMRTVCEKYGIDPDTVDLSVIGPMSLPAVREKAKATMLREHGVDNPFKLQEIQESIRAGWMSRCGVANPSQVPEIQAKRVMTFLERYGVENPYQAEDVKDRIKQICLERYGVEYAAQSQEVRDRIARTMLERYGVTSAFGLSGVRERAVASNRRKYGCDYPLQSKEIQDRIRVVCQANKAEIRARVEVTCLARYGVPCVMQSPDVREKARQTMLHRYGAENPSGVPEIVARRISTRLANGTMHTSVPEDELYALLSKRFGEDDVVRQYKSERYPFCCDFYVKSRDLFIELNATWTHGGHWFGSGLDDGRILDKWLSKDTAYYRNSIHVWSVSDLEKRQAAADAGLNYVVFWDYKLLDAELWFVMGCPDGKDWAVEYSWLPCRDVRCDVAFPKKLDGARTFMAAAKAANGGEFYKRELALWAADPGWKAGRLQGFMFANRYKYLGKLPGELTDVEILRGMGIAGVVRGYTAYDVGVMLELLPRLGVKSVYDPCSGWGERLTACGHLGIEYTGCDVNPALQDGYGRIVVQYGFKGIHTVCGDAAELDMGSGMHDMVFTCPPYGNAETYTEFGAENLDEAAFLDWWRKVVRNSAGPDTRHFAYQIDRKHRDAMNAALVDEGWRLVEEIPVGENRVRHENRAQGKTRKENYEAVQVFER